MIDLREVLHHQLQYDHKKEKLPDLLTENLEEYLEEDVEIYDKDLDKNIKIPLKERITRLFVKNGCEFGVTQWGDLSEPSKVNPYGVDGLTREEAVELVKYGNIIIGYALALGKHGDDEWFEENIFSWIKKIHQRDLKNQNVEAKKKVVKAINKKFDTTDELRGRVVQDGNVIEDLLSELSTDIAETTKVDEATVREVIKAEVE